MIFVRIPGMGDPTITLDGYDDGDWFAADSFSFGVDRESTELRKTDRSGGVVNVGFGELHACTISKSLDAATAMLAQFAVNGNSPGVADIHFVEHGRSAPMTYLEYRLDRCFVTGWTTSSDAGSRPVEAVTLGYTKLAFAPSDGGVMSWDATRRTPWHEPGLGSDSPRR